MSRVIVIAEQRDGRLKKTSFELLGLSSSAGHETHAVILGHGVENLATELAHYGADKVYVIDHETLNYYNAEAYTQALSGFLLSEKPDYILASHTPTGRDFMPHLAAKIDAGLASDCTKVEFDGNQVKAWRPVYSGKAVAEVEFLGDGVKMLTIRPNAIGAAQPDPSKTGSVEKIEVSLDGLKTKTTELMKGSAVRPDVTEATTVVSGGRSLKNADNFKYLEDLADQLNAAVGASRAAVDAGYRPHQDQVGQTGKVVSPQLYIACGISGAIQHLAGMRTSKTIVAVNSDPDAPIFQVADYSVTADLFEFIPVFTEEVKKLKESL
jgi:electron transfer flavoprotein alpha subunit